MTFYPYKMSDGSVVKVYDEDIKLIINMYHGFNSFIVTEEVASLHGSQYQSMLASSITFEEINTNAEGSPVTIEVNTEIGKVDVNIESLMNRLLKSAEYGTILACYHKDEDLHCGIKNGRLYVRKVDDRDITVILESMYIHDTEIGQFILNNCDKSDKKYMESISAMENMMQL